MEMGSNLKKLANFFNFSLLTDQVSCHESTSDRSFHGLKVIADLLLLFKEVYFPQVKAIGNCICEVLLRKQEKYRDIAPGSKLGLL